MTWGEELLRAIREDSSLCLPGLALDTLSGLLDVPRETLESRLRYRDDLRRAIKAIQAEHLGRLRAEALTAQLAGEEVEKRDEEEEDLPPALERYLEVYRETDDRLAAVRQMQTEGIAVELDDILQAMQQYPAFDRAMQRQWREGNVEAEDKLRGKARGGKDAALRMYLQGNMAEKYGTRVKVDVDVRHQLNDADRELVESVKAQIEPPKRKISPDCPLGDIVEGEVLSTTPT